MNPADNFGFHVTSPDGRRGVTMMLFRPDADGTVAWRQWATDDEVLGGREGASPVDEVLGRVEAWRRDGWSVSPHPNLILHFLRG